MEKLKSVLFLTILIAIFFNTSFEATPVRWDVNGHYYDVIDVSINWDDANTAAESSTFLGMKGHLATITSADENQFIINMLGATDTFHRSWIGGFQASGSSEPNGGWSWVTGEPFIYSNWDTNEPNNYGGGNENALEFVWGTTWNDNNKNWNEQENFIYSYVVEYEGSTSTTTTTITTTTTTTSTTTTTISCANKSPEIAGVSPTKGTYGDEVTISGTDFCDEEGVVVFKRLGKEIEAIDISSWKDDEIVVLMPWGCKAGINKIKVATAYENESNQIPFKFLKPIPHLTGLSIQTGAIGSEVVISGDGFGEEDYGSVIMFGDTEVDFYEWGTDSITVDVPDMFVGKKGRTVSVRVMTRYGTSNSKKFKVLRGQ
ncbi:MAG: hypothetical protein A3C43_06995 [Candidatus Schekmanbacteria bacterium RIFCSPHIGHO2_02_FULL_38_11]|nr:MAG: hypothetical protein A3C43_06995 [Candidatus Schekmanbacteria bacterium RIFCSPHIGHO2_02_FULL_38_11]